MDVDQLLAQAPPPVRDDGFSQRVMLALYRKRLFRQNVVLAAGFGVLLLVLLILPIGLYVPDVVQGLAVLITSPITPLVAAVAVLLLVAVHPRLLRF